MLQGRGLSTSQAIAKDKLEITESRMFFAFQLQALRFFFLSYLARTRPAGQGSFEVTVDNSFTNYRSQFPIPGIIR